MVHDFILLSFRAPSPLMRTTSRSLRWVALTLSASPIFSFQRAQRTTTFFLICSYPTAATTNVNSVNRLCGQSHSGGYPPFDVGISKRGFIEGGEWQRSDRGGEWSRSRVAETKEKPPLKIGGFSTSTCYFFLSPRMPVMPSFT